MSRAARIEEADGCDVQTWHATGCTGKCLGCLIESLVKREYGSSGVSYLRQRTTDVPALAAARTGPNCGACDDKGCHVCHPSMYPAPAPATCVVCRRVPCACSGGAR